MPRLYAAIPFVLPLALLAATACDMAYGAIVTNDLASPVTVFSLWCDNRIDRTPKSIPCADASAENLRSGRSHNYASWSYNEQILQVDGADGAILGCLRIYQESGAPGALSLRTSRTQPCTTFTER